MKRVRRIPWGIFISSVVVGAIVGGIVHLYSGLEFWLCWGMSAIAWGLVGLSTLVDDHDEEVRLKAKKGEVDV